jgi:hypothetical protein
MNSHRSIHLAVSHFCILAGALLLLSGCATFQVKKGTNHSKVPGIPFYVKQGACKHQTVYLEPYYIITLTLKYSDKSTISSSGVLSKSEFESQPVQQIRSIVGEKAKLGQKEVDRLLPLWTTHVKGKTYNPYRPENSIAPADKVTLSNTLTPEIFVSYKDDDQYFYNVDRPAIGSVQADIKLGADGTLSEASAQVEDKTISTILSLFPVSDLVKSAVIPPVSAALSETLGGPEGATVVEVELKTERKGVKFTRTTFDLNNKPPCLVPTNTLAEVTERYSLTVEDVGGGEKPDDSNNISVNGTIKLPKDKTPPK